METYFALLYFWTFAFPISSYIHTIFELVFISTSFSPIKRRSTKTHIHDKIGEGPMKLILNQDLFQEALIATLKLNACRILLHQNFVQRIFLHKESKVGIHRIGLHEEYVMCIQHKMRNSDFWTLLRPLLIEFSKLNNFLCFLGKNLSNFVSLFENSTTRIAIVRTLHCTHTFFTLFMPLTLLWQ